MSETAGYNSPQKLDSVIRCIYSSSWAKREGGHGHDGRKKEKI